MMTMESNMDRLPSETTYFNLKLYGHKIPNFHIKHFRVVYSQSYRFASHWLWLRSVVDGSRSLLPKSFCIANEGNYASDDKCGKHRFPRSAGLGTRENQTLRGYIGFGDLFLLFSPAVWIPRTQKLRSLLRRTQNYRTFSPLRLK